MDPTFDHIMQLPTLHTVIVPEEWGDLNGHMSMRHFLTVHDAAGNELFARLGFDEAYIEAHQRFFFDLEHHLLYLREVMVGDRLTAHIRLLERTDKVVHHIGYVLNHRTNELSNTLEAITAHVDLRTRKTTQLLTTDGASFDKTLTTNAQLGWDSPTNGAMGIRPRSS